MSYFVRSLEIVPSWVRLKRSMPKAIDMPILALKRCPKEAYELSPLIQQNRVI
jgi:hypothetical protein